MSIIWNWLILSSANANEYSTTVKGLVTFAPTIAIFLGLVNIHVAPNTIGSVIDQIGTFITAAAAVVAAAVSAWGIVKKIYRTIVGTNDVINTGAIHS